MNMRDLIPWARNQQMVPGRYRDEGDPFMMLHREMNRLFDDVLRGFDTPLPAGANRPAGWPQMEVVETDKEVRVSAELPGLEDKDVEVLMQDGVLTIRGERKSEIEDKERAFSERYYGRFERRIPMAWDVDEDRIDANFRNGVLIVTLPKSRESRPQVKRIAINSAGKETKHRDASSDQSGAART
ncbi:Hsp20/alpha crystallin family protein [Microvirga lotononidis]|uniref:Molecular chaperone (Small heat shock protein) n=1 Tax=Microvirga lotononidis TaxID=864069 RepID=I4YYR6_9HYPH|nr:Hsp20/alpha crystallin family protein [Microvirga lotononidis]EIM29108.1 molecular chaperone (small heat shock protein) [Microvirga lotononidis]WQO28953.1 Hsp20/alpha crystallin family protein [Microvirga lotononidis]